MMEIIKNKEEVKSAMNIIQAFANGKTIQAIDPYEDEWVDQAGLNFKALFEGQYRIKPEHTYRQFKDAEECWQELLKHKPFGWVKDTESNEYLNVYCISNSASSIDLFCRMFKRCIFIDGSPFGVKVYE